MNEKIISPGVFTKESDKTFLAAGVSNIGAAFIGPTLTGQAFMPIQVNSGNEYDELFGGDYEYSYIPYSVKRYIKNGCAPIIVRVLSTEGWSDTETNGPNDALEIFDSTGKTAAILVATSGSTFPTFTSINGNNTNFVLSASTGYVSASFDLANNNHIEKIFGTSPEHKNGNALAASLYCYSLLKYTANTNTLTAPTGTVSTGSLSNLTFTTNASYSPAHTPYITSQTLNNSKYNLFRFKTIFDGTSANKLYKVVIDSITKPASGSTDYGTFNVVVRSFDDTDTIPNPLETFSNCSLDPNSSNYVLKKIGNQYSTIDSNGKITVYGEYEQKSKYIRIDEAVGINSLPNQVVPFGYTSYYNIFSGSTMPDIPTKSYQGTADIYNSKIPWGINFDNKDVAEYFSPIADGAEAITATSLSLDDKFGHNSSSLYSGSLSASTAPTEMLKFVVGFQGGFDGTAPNKGKAMGSSITSTNAFGFDCSTSTAKGTIAFKKGLDTISNPDEFDINMIVAPGIMQQYHSQVTSHARQICSDRQDCFYLMDSVGLNDNIATAVSSVSGIDDNYTGTYYPWVKISNPTLGKQQWVPPTTLLPATFAFNDKTAAEWYAPAGLNRGGLTDAIDVRNRLTHSERDTLYEGRVNPIASFPNQGIVAWGQKTLQKKASSLDRINVRRLLISLKKFIASSGRYITFEPNSNSTRNQFLSIVNPYIDSVKRNNGVYDYKVVMDETNNSPDVIDRLALVGDIYIQPTRGGEFVKLNFNLMPTGSSFK